MLRGLSLRSFWQHRHRNMGNCRDDSGYPKRCQQDEGVVTADAAYGNRLQFGAGHCGSWSIVPAKHIKNGADGIFLHTRGPNSADSSPWNATNVDSICPEIPYMRDMLEMVEAVVGGWGCYGKRVMHIQSFWQTFLPGLSADGLVCHFQGRIAARALQEQVSDSLSQLVCSDHANLTLTKPLPEVLHLSIWAPWRIIGCRLELNGLKVCDVYGLNGESAP